MALLVMTGREPQAVIGKYPTKKTRGWLLEKGNTFYISIPLDFARSTQ